MTKVFSAHRNSNNYTHATAGYNPLQYFHIPFTHTDFNDNNIFNTSTGCLVLQEDSVVDLRWQVWIASGGLPWGQPGVVGAKIVKNPVLYSPSDPLFASTLGVGGTWIKSSIGFWGVNSNGCVSSGVGNCLDKGVAGDVYGLFMLNGYNASQPILVECHPCHTWLQGRVDAS